MIKEKMISKEIILENDLEYDELVLYLLEKYGPSKYDYFENTEFRLKNKKVRRTKEGLLCHHIDEDKAINLCNPTYARDYPFEYQKSDRLVYCNYLEHLLLHIKIGIIQFWQKHKTIDDPATIRSFVVPGIKYLCRDINTLYKNDGLDFKWRRNCYISIRELFNDYIYILNQFIIYLRNSYKKKSCIIGDRFEFSFGEGTIVDYNEDSVIIQLIGDLSIEVKIGEEELNRNLEYIKRELSVEYHKVYECLV